MTPHADLVQHPDGTCAYTHRAAARLADAGLKFPAVVEQHLTGIWAQYRGETHVVDGYRLSFCWTGPDTCVLVGERAGILTVCCPDDFATFTPPPGGPH
jgi:hypothetical protein